MEGGRLLRQALAGGRGHRQHRQWSDERCSRSSRRGSSEVGRGRSEWGPRDWSLDEGDGRGELRVRLLTAEDKSERLPGMSGHAAPSPISIAPRGIGFSGRCARCQASLRGSSPQAHPEECRARMQRALAPSQEGLRRSQVQIERENQRLPQNTTNKFRPESFVSQSSSSAPRNPPSQYRLAATPRERSGEMRDPTRAGKTGEESRSRQE